MDLETVIGFFTALMRHSNLHVYRFHMDSAPEMDMGLRKALGMEPPERTQFGDRIENNTIYMVEDIFGWRYLGLRLPGGGQLLCVGPYLLEHMDDQMIMERMEALGLPPALLVKVRRFYLSVPIVPSESVLLSAVTALGEALFGEGAFRSETVSRRTMLEELPGRALPFAPGQERAEMELLELRYEREAELMYAIAHGQAHKANAILSAFHPAQMDKRSSNPLRNTKNYAIVSNTLMRKAVQQGGVHPYYIDQLSSAIARRIEQTMTVEETQQLILSMAHKYCLLVKNHNMNEYSQPVQRVILRTDSEIAGDLSLSAHAKHIGVNASYLSALFKKETGVTVTDYVNARRVEYAVFLLNSTDMQIQTIAQHCGLMDVNYFTRLFRKLKGKTPTQYRQDAQTHAP